VVRRLLVMRGTTSRAEQVVDRLRSSVGGCAPWLAVFALTGVDLCNAAASALEKE